jgi:alkanesulfonate monooxygenase
MKVGLYVNAYTWAGGPAEIGNNLIRIVREAEAVGFDSIWVQDHCFQGEPLGPSEAEMLEAYTTLGFAAAVTSRIELGALATSVTFRNPGLLVKAVTTLDVLSGGRAWLGIGAGWNMRENLAYGFSFPSLSTRFAMVEETIRIAKQMWAGEVGPFEGAYYKLAETINSPNCLRAPRPPILIAGGGEKRTLRLVAQYADACHVFGDASVVKHKFNILERHCNAVGRDYESIRRFGFYRLDTSDNSGLGRTIEEIRLLSEAGVTGIISPVTDVDSIGTFERLGTKLLPQVAKL